MLHPTLECTKVTTIIFVLYIFSLSYLCQDSQCSWDVYTRYTQDLDSIRLSVLKEQFRSNTLDVQVQ